jgi:hypothetical protein
MLKKIKINILFPNRLMKKFKKRKTFKNRLKIFTGDNPLRLFSKKIFKIIKNNKKIYF